jgi:cell division protein FtsA
MNEARPLVGIDLGSSSVSVVVGEMEEERLVVRGCGVARHDGARKGVIANLEEVAEAVHVAAEEAEAMASVPVEVAHVGIGGTPIRGVPSTASVPVTGRDHTVTADDLQRALAACAQVSIPNDFRVLDIIPCGFALDGQPGMDHPVGMPGTRLDATAYVLYANRTHAETVAQSINHAAVAVKQLVFEPLAAAEAVLTNDEKDLGCLLLDIDRWPRAARFRSADGISPRIWRRCSRRRPPLRSEPNGASAPPSIGRVSTARRLRCRPSVATAIKFTLQSLQPRSCTNVRVICSLVCTRCW